MSLPASNQELWPTGESCDCDYPNYYYHSNEMNSFCHLAGMAVCKLATRSSTSMAVGCAESDSRRPATFSKIRPRRWTLSSPGAAPTPLVAAAAAAAVARRRRRTKVARTRRKTVRPLHRHLVFPHRRHLVITIRTSGRHRPWPRSIN